MISESGDDQDLLFSTGDAIGEGRTSATSRRLSLPSVPDFTGEKLDDEDAFSLLFPLDQLCRMEGVSLRWL